MKGGCARQGVCRVHVRSGFQQNLDACDMVPPCRDVKGGLAANVGVRFGRGILSKNSFHSGSIAFLTGDQETIPFRVFGLVEKGFNAAVIVIVVTADSIDAVNHTSVIFYLCTIMKAGCSSLFQLLDMTKESNRTNTADHRSSSNTELFQLLWFVDLILLHD